MSQPVVNFIIRDYVQFVVLIDYEGVEVAQIQRVGRFYYVRGVPFAGGVGRMFEGSVLQGVVIILLLINDMHFVVLIYFERWRKTTMNISWRGVYCGSCPQPGSIRSVM